jgi:hypothetical protein
MQRPHEEYARTIGSTAHEANPGLSDDLIIISKIIKSSIRSTNKTGDLGTETVVIPASLSEIPAVLYDQLLLQDPH